MQKQKQFVFFDIRKLLVLVLSCVIFSICSNTDAMTVHAAESDFIIQDGTLVEYKGSDKNVVIPDTVKKIGDKAFYKNRTLKTITIPNSVEKIGEEAFAYCSSLLSVDISDNIETIEEWAFAECEKLESVRIGNRVTDIKEWAFYYCKNLKEVTIGNAVSSIGKFAFQYCAEDLIFYVLKNDYVKAYCEKYNITYKEKGEASVLVSEIQIGYKEVELKKGDSIQLVASVLPYYASNLSVSWKSNNKLVAVVSNGEVTAVGKGTAIITCTAKDGSNVTASCTVTVETKSEDSGKEETGKEETGKDNESTEDTFLELSDDEITMEYNTKKQLEYSILPRQKVIFSSDNEDVATVSETGAITAKKAGLAIITATAEDGTTANCLITVLVKPKKVIISKKNLVMTMGEKYTLKATFSPSSISKAYKTLKWKSNNTRVAAVSKTGKVTAKTKGACTITVTTLNGKKASCKIIVNEK